MRTYFLLFIIAGIFFQSQAQTKQPPPPPDAIGNISIVEDVEDKGIEENIPDSIRVYSFTQVMPSFPGGGDTAFISFIKKNLIYPEDAKKNNIAGNVYVMFIIERDGSLSDIHIHRGLYPSCDQAAIAVVSKSPRWNPGMNNGKIVRTKRVQRIQFK